MSYFSSNAASPLGAVVDYIAEKRALIAEMERDMAITYRTFAKDLMEPILDDIMRYGSPFLSTALDVIAQPGQFVSEIKPEGIAALQARYEVFLRYPVAVVPLTAEFDFHLADDDASCNYEIEMATFVLEPLWRSIAHTVQMPVGSKVCINIHHTSPMRVEVNVPDMWLLELDDLRRFKVAFDRVWAEPKFYAQMTYNDFFVNGT